MGNNFLAEILVILADQMHKSDVSCLLELILWIFRIVDQPSRLWSQPDQSESPQAKIGRKIGRTF